MNVVIMGVMIMTVTATMNNMEKENIVVSACLLGINCKYNGENKVLLSCGNYEPYILFYRDLLIQLGYNQNNILNIVSK